MIYNKNEIFLLNDNLCKPIMSLANLPIEILLKKIRATEKQILEQQVNYNTFESTTTLNLANDILKLSDEDILSLLTKDAVVDYCTIISKNVSNNKQILLCLEKEMKFNEKKKADEIKSQEKIEEEVVEEEFVQLTPIINENLFYELKTCFCQDNTNFPALIKQYRKLIMITMKYKYNTEYSNKPEFMMTNIHKGHVQSFQELATKKLYGCVRFYKYDTNPEYESHWIINANENISYIFGDLIESFDITFHISTGNRDNFIKLFNRLQGTEDNLMLELENYIV